MSSLRDKAQARAEEAEQARERVREEIKKRRQTKTVHELRASNKALTDEIEKLREVNELLVCATDERSDYRLKLPKRRGHKPRTLTVSALSDLHVEERVDPKTVNGLNEHNIEIAEAKLERYWRNVVALYRLNASHVDIVRHILWVGGDLFSGHIHEDLVEACEFSPTNAILWLLPRIREGIKYLRAELDCSNLHVVWNYGNHGRNTKKPRISTAADHSYEWMLGQILQGEFKDADGITFQAERGYHTYVQTGDFVLRTHHGDWTRYGGGVGGITIPLNKAIDNWNKIRRANLDLIGHYHTSMNLRHLVTNGSLIGFSPFSIFIKGHYEPPSQAYFQVDLERLEKTIYTPVHLLDLPKSRR